MNTLSSVVSPLQYDRYYIEKNYRELQKMKSSIDLSTLSHSRLKLLALKINSVKGCHIIRIGKHDKDSLIETIRSTVILTSRPKPTWNLTDDDWAVRDIGHPNHARIVETRYIHRDKAILWTACIGRETLTKILQLQEWLIQKGQVGVVGFRQRQRLPKGSECGWELKCWGLKEATLDKLTELELDRQKKLGIEPPSFYQIIPLSGVEAKTWREYFEDLQLFKSEGLEDIYQKGLKNAEENGIVAIGNTPYRKAS